MTDNITLRRADAEQIRQALASGKRLYAALAALDAALAEPDAATMLAQIAMLQRPLAADMAATINANIDSMSITDEPDAALAEPVHPGYIIGSHWLETSYSRIAAGEAEADVLAEVLGARGWVKPDATREPDVADLFAQFAAKQKPLDADMAAIINANLDSLYITEDALREGVDAQDCDLWQRRADEEVLKEYQKRYGKPEPVAWLWKDGFRFLGGIEPKDGSELPLYAAPPEPDAKREPATAEQVIAAHGPSWGPSATADFFTGFRAAERFHGITKEDK